MSWVPAADNLKLCCSAFASRLRVFNSRYYPQSEDRALFDIVRIVGVRTLHSWLLRVAKGPVMWIELREIVWLASIVSSLSILSVGVAVVLALAL